jgi:chemotaxis protein MotB
MLNIRFKEKTNAWPGFVDLFSNLVIILIFLLIVFVFLWTTTNVFHSKNSEKKVAELRQQNDAQTEQISQMSSDEAEAKRLLLLSRSQLELLENEKEQLNQRLDVANDSMYQLQSQKDQLNQRLNIANESMNQLQSQFASLSEEYQKTARATAQEREILNAQIQELHAQLTNTEQMSAAQQQSLAVEVSRLNQLLDTSEQRAKDQEIQYVEMSTRLNKAMADKIAELGQYQSEFYAAIKKALQYSNKVDTSTDRFIVPSDILFSQGAYNLSPEGERQLKLIAPAIAGLETVIPGNVAWIIRVDGHTDKTPVVRGTHKFKNNTELSLLRAQAVVRELVKYGVPQRHLVPSGFGETHPVDSGNSPKSLQKNRRIELRLTNP